MTMTLEQVRNRLRGRGEFYRVDPFEEREMADAIDAHLLSQDAEIADLIGKRDFLLRHYNLAESRLAVCDEDTSYYLEQLDAIVDAMLLDSNTNVRIANE